MTNMIKRNSLLPLVMIFLTAFLFSCASLSPNNKILVGKWKPEYAEKYIEPGKEKKTETKVVSDTAAEKKSKTVTNEMPNQQRADAEWERMVNTEKRTPLIVNEDHTLQKTFHQKTVKGSWKLKNKGKRLIMTESTTGQKLRADILEINDSMMVVVERLPVGDIKVKYVKEK